MALTTESLTGESNSHQSGRLPDRTVIASWVAVLIMATALGFWLGTRQSSAPRDNSPEAGFARDMMTHHAQAVDMATLIRDRTDDPAIRQLALDIMLTQQAQIGQMQGWLAVWKLPIVSNDPAMTWMGMATTDRMPGMATPDELNQLRDLTGVTADGLFLNLMIWHHRGGVAMAEAALERTQRPEISALAQSILNAQTNEIIYMQDLLQRKGFLPVPEATPMMDHGDMSP